MPGSRRHLFLRSLCSGLLLPGALAVTPPAARAELEVIELRHRTAEQVLPVLQPFVEPGGVLTGQRNQLIVRTSGRNLDELRRVLAGVDVPQRRLVISVRFDGDTRRHDESIEVRGTVRSGGVAISNERAPAAGTRITIGARDAGSAGTERVDQRVQVLDGGRAFIATGAARPVPQEIVRSTPAGSTVIRGMNYPDASTGFDVVPRVVGERVTLDISPQRERFDAPSGSAPPGTIEAQRASTTISARLGEWVEIGGTDVAASGAAAGIGMQRSASASETRRIWVRVDDLGR